MSRRPYGQRWPTLGEWLTGIGMWALFYLALFLA